MSGAGLGPGDALQQAADRYHKEKRAAAEQLGRDVAWSIWRALGRGDTGRDLDRFTEKICDAIEDANP